MAANILSHYNGLVEIYAKATQDINDLKLNVGYKECYLILRKGMPFDHFHVVKDKVQKIDACEKKSLTAIKVNNVIYSIELILMEDYDRFKHHDINDIIFDLDSNERRIFLAQMNMLESWLLENSRMLYADIESDIKLSKQIRTLEASKKKRFQYHYSSAINKKLLFVACIST
jgi:hypothetical protein